MYCLIAHNQIKPGKVQALAKALDKDVMPYMSRTPGFHAMSVSAGPKGEYTAFVTWDAKAGCDDWVNGQGRKKALANFGDLVEGPMKLEVGEVIFQSK